MEGVYTQNQSPSVSSQTNALVSGNCRHDDPNIHAVTLIKVTSTREGMPWKHEPFAIDGSVA